ncbi:hypothetical protein JOF29_000187 [Kribbella aluminosa]|uniref:Uncharacterized protein n=1 Tax=Kribbella aluminosa TaxID=416017 RepID=A0ABS4UBY7_9ACTN|nr:hypothetical protein [Kribbella aluminosa]MBP2349104.1 hypothetical protein [Kribbella aluminosa]
MTDETWWLVYVRRYDELLEAFEVIEVRVVPTGLADAYADVFRLRYPDDDVRAREATDYERAYPPDKPYDMGG